MTISPAKKIFLKRIKEVRILVNLCELGGLSLSEKNAALCRAALVVLCSHMEGFFEDLIADILHFHENASTKIADLPIELRVRQVLWNQNLTNGDYVKRWNSIAQIRINKIADINDCCSQSALNPDTHILGFANPGSAEVLDLFSTVGINEIWGIASSSHSDLLRKQLDGLVSRRNQIAHGDFSSKVTPVDVSNYIRNMAKLSVLFDRSVAQYLRQYFYSADPWSVLSFD